MFGTTRLITARRSSSAWLCVRFSIVKTNGVDTMKISDNAEKYPHLVRNKYGVLHVTEIWRGTTLRMNVQITRRTLYVPPSSPSRHNMKDLIARPLQTDFHTVISVQNKLRLKVQRRANRGSAMGRIRIFEPMPISSLPISQRHTNFQNWRALRKSEMHPNHENAS